MLRVSSECSENYDSLHPESCTGNEECIEIMRKILKVRPESLNEQQMPFLFSPLRNAAKEVTQWFIRVCLAIYRTCACLLLGIDACVCSYSGAIGIHVAGHAACVSFLMKNGAALQAEDRRGSTPLEAAVSGNHTECVRLLLAAGADPNPRSSNPSLPRTAPLSVACASDLSEIAQLLLSHAALTEDLPEQCSDLLLVTPAAFCVTYGSTACLRLLLLHGAATDLRTHEAFSLRPALVAKHSLSHLACTLRPIFPLEVNKIMLRMMWEFGVDLWQKNSQQFTALQMLQMKPLDPKSVELALMLQKLMSQPLSLKSLCRLVVKSAINPRCYLETVKLMDVPKTVVNFLSWT